MIVRFLYGSTVDRRNLDVRGGNPNAATSVSRYLLLTKSDIDFSNRIVWHRPAFEHRYKEPGREKTRDVRMNRGPLILAGG